MPALPLLRDTSPRGVSGRAAVAVKPDLVVVPRRRRWPAAIAVLAWVLVSAGLLGAAVFHTQLAERQLRIDRLEKSVNEQRELFDQLRYERAELRSPVRLSDAAGALGMHRGPIGQFLDVTPEQVAEQLAAAGAIDHGSVQIVIESDPLDQFRDVKAVTAGRP